MTQRSTILLVFLALLAGCTALPPVPDAERDFAVLTLYFDS